MTYGSIMDIHVSCPLAVGNKQKERRTVTKFLVMMSQSQHQFSCNVIIPAHSELRSGLDHQRVPSTEDLTFLSHGCSAVSKTQIFTVSCPPSKHPLYMTYLFNYASFHRDKKSTADLGQVVSIFHQQLHSPEGFDSKQTGRNFGCMYDIC